MANIFTKIYKSITTKSHAGSSVSLQSHSLFNLFNGFFSFSFGTFNTVKLERYVSFYYLNPYLFQVINKIASIVSRLPRMLVDSDGKEITDKDILRLWKRPNKEQSNFTFYFDGVANLKDTGNLFIRGEQAVGFSKGIQQMTILRSKDVEINLDRTGNFVVSYTYEDNDSFIIIPIEEVLHIKNPNLFSSGVDRFYGVPETEASIPAIESSNEIFNAKKSIYKHRGANGFITTDTDQPMVPGERNRMQESLDKEIGGSGNVNKVVVSNSKLRFVQMSMSPTDLKITEGANADLRIIAANFGLSSVLFNDPSNTTFNNIREANKAAYRDTYIPTAEHIDQELSIWLTDKFGTDVVIKILKDDIDILQETNLELATRVVNELAAGIVTIEEAREILGRDEI